MKTNDVQGGGEGIFYQAEDGRTQPDALLTVAKDATVVVCSIPRQDAGVAS